MCCNLCTTRLGFSDCERSSQFLCSLTHRGEANTGWTCFLNTYAVVMHLKLESIVGEKTHLACLRMGMTDHVRHGFLYDAIGRDLDRSWQRRQ